MKNNSFWKGFWRIVSYKDTAPQAIKQDILVKTITCIILAVVSGILTLLNINKHFSFMTITTGVLTVGMVMAAILCAKFKHPDIASIVVAVLGIVIFTDYAVNGENDGFAILWIIMVPLFCMLWMGIRIGFLVSLYFQVLLFVIFYTGIRESMSAYYSDIFMTRFPILYLGTFVVSSWIFYQMQKSQMQSDRAGRLDVLTGIDNRLGFSLKLSKVFKETVVPCVHVIVFDINRLKYINDECGHKAGDEVIIEACRLISQVFENHIIFARVGGDEFYMLSTSEDLDFEERRERLSALTLEWRGQWAPFLSISCGHASGRDVTLEGYTGLLHIADQEMYKDKSRYYMENSIDRRRR